MKRSREKLRSYGQMTGLLSVFLQNTRIQKATKFIGGNYFILDIGCGSAPILNKLPYVKSYLGIDLNADLIEHNKKIYPDFEFICLDIEKETPIISSSFDNILLIAVVEHLLNPSDVFKRLKNLLSNNGRIILTTPILFGGIILKIGAKFGLFSKEAEKEHKMLLSKEALFRMVKKCGLKIDYFAKFLFGMNQIIVLRK